MHAYNKAVQKTYDNVRSKQSPVSVLAKSGQAAVNHWGPTASNDVGNGGRCPRCRYLNIIYSEQTATLDGDGESGARFCVMCGFALGKRPQATSTAPATIETQIQQAMDLLTNNMPSNELPESALPNPPKVKPAIDIRKPTIDFRPPSKELPNVYPYVRPDSASIDQLNLDPGVKGNLKERLRPEPIISMREAAKEKQFLASVLEIENAVNMEESYQEISEAQNSTPILTLDSVGQHQPQSYSQSAISPIASSHIGLHAASVSSFNTQIHSISDGNVSRKGRRNQSQSLRASHHQSSVLSTGSMTSSRMNAAGTISKGGYLDHIEPITVYYKQLMNRDEELNGLTVKVLNSIRGQPINSEYYDVQSTDAENAVEGISDQPIENTQSEHKHWYWGKERERQDEMRMQNVDSRGGPEATHPMIWTDLLVHVYSEEISSIGEGLGEAVDPIGDPLAKDVNPAITEHENHADESSPSSKNEGNEKQAGAVISRIYRNCCLRIKRAVEYAEINFRRDPMTWPNALRSLLTKFETVMHALEQAKVDDGAARDSYDQFKRNAKSKRAEAGNAIASALQQVSSIHAHYRNLYEAGSRDFHTKRAAQEFTLQLNYKKMSDEKMDHIQEEADKEIAKYGQILKDLQQVEVELIEELRSKEFAAISAVKLWRPRHAKAVHTGLVAKSRVEAILRDVAARHIQRTARRRLLMYFRDSKKRQIMRRIKRDAALVNADSDDDES